MMLTRISGLNLKFHSYIVLRRQGIETIDQLTRHTADELLAIRNIGPATLMDIVCRLKEHGTSLKEV